MVASKLASNLPLSRDICQMMIRTIHVEVFFNNNQQFGRLDNEDEDAKIQH